MSLNETSIKTSSSVEGEKNVEYKNQFQQMMTKEVRSENYNLSDNTYRERLIIRDNSFYSQQKFLEMQNCIQNLELELSNYKSDRRSYEDRISAERTRVAELNAKMQSLKMENNVLVTERRTFEEKFTSETSRVSELELKLQNVSTESEFLYTKVKMLEETLKSERYQMESYTERFKASLNKTGSGSGKGLEEKIRNQQQRIYELEALLEGNNADADTLKSSLSSYESTIEHQKIQVETILKRLQGSNADNEFLIKKLELLSQTLRNYQFEIESMSTQLKNAKVIVAQLHAELARANGAVAKYQAAMSSAYMLNGELMTKVTSMSSFSQYQMSTESNLDILSLNFSKLQTSGQLNFNTSALLEATGSETFMKFIKNSSSSSEENVNFQPMKPEPINSFTPINNFESAA